MDDRPALAEIEITPEMIEAGAAAASLYDSRDSYEVMLPPIFRAMLSACRDVCLAPTLEPLSNSEAHSD